MNKTKLIVIDSLLIAITIVSKEALSFLANVEVVTLFMIIFTLYLPFKDSIFISIGYSIVESLLYGVNIFTISYFIVWILIVLFVFILKKHLNNYINVAIFSFCCGLFFDLPFSIPFFMSGFNVGISYLMSGIIFTIVHAISNMIIATILFDPLSNIFSKLVLKLHIN